MKLFSHVRSWFAWRTIRNSGAWLYQANDVTGDRRAVRIRGPGNQPLDLDWLYEHEPVMYRALVEHNYWRGEPRPNVIDNVTTVPARELMMMQELDARRMKSGKATECAT